MKIRVERDGLADAVAWVARSLPSRPPVPVLGGVLLDAGADGAPDALTVSGFDYEVSATVGVPATIADGGRLLVPGRLLGVEPFSMPAERGLWRGRTKGAAGNRRLDSEGCCGRSSSA